MRREHCNRGMSYTGTVENGKVSLPPGVQLPNGTKVRVETVETPAEGGTLADSLGEFIGVLGDLPADFAKNHDHYIHGAPKK